MRGSISDCLCIKMWHTHRVCRHSITVKVARKWDLPLTWLRCIPCITMVRHFLMATYECAWTDGGLATFSICWCLILFFRFPRTWERLSWQRGHLSTYGGWAVGRGLSQLQWLRWGGGSKWHVETQSARIYTARNCFPLTSNCSVELRL